AILNHAFPLGERRGHHDIFRRSNAGEIEGNPSSPQSWSGCHDIPTFKLIPRAEPLQALEVNINGPSPDGTASRQTHFCSPEPGKQRAENKDRGAHFSH